KGGCFAVAERTASIERDLEPADSGNALLLAPEEHQRLARRSLTQARVAEFQIAEPIGVARLAAHPRLGALPERRLGEVGPARRVEAGPRRPQAGAVVAPVDAQQRAIVERGGLARLRAKAGFDRRSEGLASIVADGKD